MRLIGLFSLVALAACNSNTANEQRLTRVTAAQVMLEEVTGYAPTQVARMPSGGVATFNGYATLAISTNPVIADDDVIMLGTSALEVRFDQPGPVTGSITDLDALVTTARGGSEFQSVTGVIDIGANNSLITGNQWSADYEGDLSWASGGVDVDGNMIGQFQGNRTSDPANIIKGVIGQDVIGLGVTDSGALATVELYIYGTDTP